MQLAITDRVGCTLIDLQPHLVVIAGNEAITLIDLQPYLVVIARNEAISCNWSRSLYNGSEIATLRKINID
jgi:hypothetical protein